MDLPWYLPIQSLLYSSKSCDEADAGERVERIAEGASMSAK